MSSEIKRAEDLASDANEDLKRALPFLEVSINSLQSITKSHITEIKAYSSPPEDIIMVMSAVMTVLGSRDLDWVDIKKEMSNPKFIDRLICLDKDNISEETMKRIQAFTKNADFLPQILCQKSLAAGALCAWVRAVEDYTKLLMIIRPKIERAEDAKLIV